MLQQPLFDKLAALRLTGFRQGLEEQAVSAHYADLTFEERLSLLVDRNGSAARTPGLPEGFVPRTCSKRPPWRISISPLPVVWTSGASSASCSATGSNGTSICSSSGRPGPGRATSPAPWARAACRQGISVRYLRTSRLLRTPRPCPRRRLVPEAARRLRQGQSARP